MSDIDLNSKFPGDTVEGFSPITFALQFVIAMRKEKRLSHVPSLRATLAIPRLLTARYFRLRKLDSTDYIAAAVFNTPYEDQEIAERVAREILFPPQPEKPRRAKSAAKPPAATTDDPMADILASLEAANIDLSDLSSLSDLVESEATTELGAYDLFEHLLNSIDPRERSLAELLILFGGPGQMELNGIDELSVCSQYARDLLRAAIGTLSPDHIFYGCGAGYGEMLCRETKLPWELAGVLAGCENREKLTDHLEDVLASGSTRDIGKTLRFLRPHVGVIDDSTLEKLRCVGLSRVRDLTEFTALLDGLGEWMDPPTDLVSQSAIENPVKALQAANWISERFGQALHVLIFNYWRTHLSASPTLLELCDVSVPCAEWETELDAAYRRFLADVDEALAARDVVRDGLPEIVTESVALAERLYKTGNTIGSALAGLMVTDLLCRIRLPDVLLALLDSFLEHHVSPTDLQQLVSHAEQIGIDPSEIYDRLGDALDQFHNMVLANARSPERYAMLAVRIRSIPSDMVEELGQMSFSTGNQEGMAVILAVELGAATGLGLPNDFVISSICFKGIGSGANLLKQWFTHGPGIQGEIRGRIKELARNALLELGMDWASRGTGSADQGLVPQNQIRPFTAADDIDQLDIENTLDSLISSGKRLTEMNEDDLVVHDTTGGKASFGVLIDISGSMAGEELSICAISVVMLLARLKSQEIAVALFESNTHVIKGFQDERLLDDVADQLLELQAMGGTCVDAALSWVRREFEDDHMADRQVLFLLSDFCFSETIDDLRRPARELADLHVRFLGAAHGPAMQEVVDVFLEAMSGEAIKLKRFDQLPGILGKAIESISNTTR